MSYNGEDSGGTGLPTRAIHEAYLDMQRALKRYRQATDRGDDRARERAHGELQESVLTLYEMLRPLLKHNNTVSDYWEGKPPSYPRNGDAEAPDPEDGVAILAWQIHPQTYQLNGTDPGEVETLREWHDALPLADSARLHTITVENGQVFAQYQTYEMGLRHLDSWQTEFHEVNEDVGGFMGGQTTTRTARQRVPVEKLRRAARELSNVVEKLGLHARVDTDDLQVDEL